MSVEYKDYYKILGVDRKATQEEIAKAYKKLARKHHPDLNKNTKESEEKFKEVNEANDVLKDPEKRAMYDQLGPNYQHGQQFRPNGFSGNFSNMGGGFGGSGYSDFFETIFGNFGGGGNSSFSQDPFSNFSRGRKGANIESTLSLTLEEAFHGGKKNITLTGVNGKRSLEVNIPAGVKNGAKIRLAGQGEVGTNAANGDLLLKIAILPHAQYSLDGADIIYDLTLAPWDAVLGCKMRVPTLNGAVELTIAPGTSSGKKFRLRNKGLGSGAAQGDLYIRIGIKAPTPLTPEQEELWLQLKTLDEQNTSDNEKE